MIIYLYRVPELEVEEENQVQEMTLDEWKNLQEQTRPKPEFNIRKPESTVPSKAVVIHKSRYRDDVSLLSWGNMYCSPHQAQNGPLSVDVKTESCVWECACGGQRFGTHLVILLVLHLTFLFLFKHHQGWWKGIELGVLTEEYCTFSVGLECKPGRHRAKGSVPFGLLEAQSSCFKGYYFDD